jgi:hypothetical protein
MFLSSNLPAIALWGTFSYLVKHGNSATHLGLYRSDVFRGGNLVGIHRRFKVWVVGVHHKDSYSERLASVASSAPVRTPDLYSTREASYPSALQSSLQMPDVPSNYFPFARSRDSFLGFYVDL